MRDRYSPSPEENSPYSHNPVRSRVEVGVLTRRLDSSLELCADPQSRFSLMVEWCGKGPMPKGLEKILHGITHNITTSFQQTFFSDIERITKRTDLATHINDSMDHYVRTFLLSVMGQVCDQARLLNNQSFDISCTIVIPLTFPDQTKRLYVSAIGHTRCYLVREGEVYQMTQDHSDLQKYFDEHEISDEEQYRIEEEGTHATSSNRDASVFRLRDRIYGCRSWDTDAPLFACELLDGDRIALVSAGIHLTLTDEELTNVLCTSTTALEAVIKLQQEADALVGEGSRIRAVAKDLSAYVFDVANVHRQTSVEAVLDTRWQVLRTIQSRKAEARQQMLDQGKRRLQSKGSQDDLKEEIFVQKTYYQACLQEWDVLYPVRFQAGDHVRMLHHGQRMDAVVKSYNPSTFFYYVTVGNQSFSVSRYELEKELRREVVKKGDVYEDEEAKGLWIVRDIHGPRVSVSSLTSSQIHVWSSEQIITQIGARSHDLAQKYELWRSLCQLLKDSFDETLKFQQIPVRSKSTT